MTRKMETQEITMYTTEDLRSRLGTYFISKIHAKASGATYKQIRNVLAGKASSKDLIKSVMEAAGAAIAEVQEVEEMNKHITRKKAA